MSDVFLIIGSFITLAVSLHFKAHFCLEIVESHVHVTSLCGLFLYHIFMYCILSSTSTNYVIQSKNATHKKRYK